jgi:Uma2 family endonuclease
MQDAGGGKMVSLQSKGISLDEYESAFAVQAVEVVNGAIIPMSPGGRGQPNVTTNLALSLGLFVQERDPGKVYVEASFVLDGSPRKRWVKDSRVPDVAFVSRERINAHEAAHPDPNDPWWLAPDLAVEVISPTDQYEGLLQKVADYLSYGVRMVWAINPMTRTITIHTSENPLGRTLREGDILDAALLIEGWSMPVVDLFVK